MKRILAGTAVFFASVCLAPAQAPQVVRLNVVANDKQGQPVADLQPGELHVLEDGKPQPIVMFRVNDSRQHPPAAALAPREYSNRAPGTQAGATIILFDLLNGSFTDREYMVVTLVKALANVESPGSVYLYLITNDGTLFPVHGMPEDVAAAATPQDQNWNLQAKPLLDAAIQKVYGLRPVDDRDTGIRIVSTLKVLGDLGSQLAARPGRQNVVWITNGFPLQLNYGNLCHNISLFGATATCSGNYVDFTPVVRFLGQKLDEAGVSFYPVDEWNVDGGDRIMVKETLDTFADMTGGKSYASGGAKDAIPDALRTMHFSYTVAFQPSRWDGKFHKLRVTTDRKGVEIQSEQGFTAAAPVDQTANLLKAGASTNAPIAAIGLRAEVSAGTQPNTMHLRLRIDAANLTMVQQNGHYVGQFALLYAGVSSSGFQQLAKPSTISLNWTPEQFNNAVKGGIPVPDDVPVPAGLSEVRIVVVDGASNRVGALSVPVPK